MISRVFSMEDLDCANCARKIQDKVSKVDGVSNVNVSFLNQKMTFDVEDDKNEAAVEEIRAIVKKMEPDVIFEEMD